jgi:hypothetical protein
MSTTALELSCTGSVPDAHERAVLQTLAYADVFDYPLSEAEVHRYLIGARATREEAASALTWLQDAGAIEARHGWYTLPGRDALAEVRRSREEHARRLWPRARSYARTIGALPFVRFVGVSGALAVDNVCADADIDYFIVTEGGRLWTARALIVALVRLARRRGDVICPNYLVSERAIELGDRNLFTAHELTQLVPIVGRATYTRLRKSNAWAIQFLPNASGPPRPAQVSNRDRGRIRAAAEWLGRSAPGRWVERWERERKVRRFERGSTSASEASFGPDWCKGHFGQHGHRALAAYAAAVSRLESWPA